MLTATMKRQSLPSPPSVDFSTLTDDRQATPEDRKDQRLDQTTQRSKASTMGTSFRQDHHIALQTKATHSSAAK